MNTDHIHSSPESKHLHQTSKFLTLIITTGKAEIFSTDSNLSKLPTCPLPCCLIAPSFYKPYHLQFLVFMTYNHYLLYITVFSMQTLKKLTYLFYKLLALLGFKPRTIGGFFVALFQTFIKVSLKSTQECFCNQCYFW